MEVYRMETFCPVTFHLSYELNRQKRATAIPGAPWRYLEWELRGRHRTLRNCWRRLPIGGLTLSVLTWAQFWSFNCWVKVDKLRPYQCCGSEGTARWHSDLSHGSCTSYFCVSEVGLSHSWVLILRILCSVGGQLSFQFKVEFFSFEISWRTQDYLYSWVGWKPHWPVHGVLGRFCWMRFGIWLWLLREVLFQGNISLCGSLPGWNKAFQSSILS